MILYNVTIKIEQAVADDWLRWMREVHIPDVLETGFFTSCKLLQIRGEEDERDPSYAIQYVCPSQEQFDIYTEKFSRELQREHTERYRNKFIAIRTIMDIVEETNLFASKS